MKDKIFIWIAGGIALILLFTFLDPSVFPFPKCPFKSLTGLECPGCGSQRAIYHVLHGNIAESIRLNILFLPAIFYGLIGWVTSSFMPSYWPVVQRKFYGLTAAYVALTVIMMFWIGRNLF